MQNVCLVRRVAWWGGVLADAVFLRSAFLDSPRQIEIRVSKYQGCTNQLALHKRLRRQLVVGCLEVHGTAVGARGGTVMREMGPGARR